MRAATVKLPSIVIPFTVALGGAAVAGYLLPSLLQVLALGYALLFLAVTWSRPQLALMLIFASAPFSQDLSGGGAVIFSIAEIHLLLASVVFLAQITIRRRGLPVGPLTLPVMLYLAVCLFSSSQHWRGRDAMVSLIQMVMFLMVTVGLFSASTHRAADLRWALYGLVGVGILISIVGIVSGTTYYMGIQKNGIGGALSCAVLVAIELWLAAKHRTWKRVLILAVVIITAGLFFTLSRGAWLGTAAGLFVLLFLRQQLQLLLRVAIVLVPLLAFCWNALPPESREYAVDLSADRYNIRARYVAFDYARGQFEQSPIYGTGVGLRKEYDANGIFWLTLAETGVAGLATFLLIHLVLFGMIWSARRGIPLTDPLYSFLVIAGALVVSKLAQGSVDHYWNRGASMMAWASVGMATRVYYVARGRILAMQASRSYEPSATSAAAKTTRVAALTVNRG